MSYDRDEAINASRALMRRANRIVNEYTIMGAVIGAAIPVALLVANGVMQEPSGASLIIIAIFALFGGAIGRRRGKSKVVLMKIQAQTLAVLVEIEGKIGNVTSQS